MTNKCKICLKKANFENAIQCLNSESWYHYMCLGCDENLIRNIKSGVVTILCPRKRCDRAEYIQADLEEDICGDDVSEEDCRIRKLAPIISLNKPPMKYKKRVIPCINGCEMPNSDDDDDVEEENENNDDDDEDVDTLSCDECLQKKKWCPKNPIDFCDTILAEEKHQCDKDTLSMKSLFVNKKTQHNSNKLKSVEKNEDLLKIKNDQETRSKKSSIKSRISVKLSESSLDEKPAPKTLDQSVIEVLESVCLTAKRLHIQIRELMCKIVSRNK